jgi:hypothetical protein
VPTHRRLLTSRRPDPDLRLVPELFGGSGASLFHTDELGVKEMAEEEAKVKDSQVFNMAAPGEDEDLRDAWGRPAEADEDVDFAESVYMKSTAAELKEELKKREEAGREFDKSQIKTKRDLVAALDADDRAQAEESKE